MQVPPWRELFHGSLRRQFLVPLVSLLLLISLTVTLAAQQFAVRSARSATEAKLRDLLELCKLARFPLTDSVLQQLGDFTGCKLQLANQVPAVDKLCTVELLPNQSFDAYAIELPTNANTPASPPSRYLLALASPRDRLERAAQAFWLPMATGILSTLAVGLAALWIANRMVRRLESLESQVRRIAQGNYDTVSVDPNAKDSIASLTHTINAMSQQLEKAQGEIARAERARLINIIASGMAHQLRNSLAGALLLLQTVLKRLIPPPEEIPFAIQQIQLAEESIRRLLTISRPERSIDDQPLTVAEINKQIECYTQAMILHHQLQWRTICQPNDDIRLVPAGNSAVSSLLNLAINAIEAHIEYQQKNHANPTNTIGTIECCYRFKPDTHQHQWTIRDNGPGPDPTIVSQMFDPFVTGKREGVGLGLPTAALLARELGGDLQWRRQNGWTEFEWTISAHPKGKKHPSTA
jgi:signal transduction histidine kinase